MFWMTSSATPTEPMTSAEGGSPWNWTTLRRGKRPRKPNTRQSPAMSIGEAGSSGVTLASSSRNGRGSGKPKPSPTKRRSGARVVSPRV